MIDIAAGALGNDGPACREDLSERVLRRDARAHRWRGKLVTEAVPLENAYAGEQGARYELRPEDLLEADRQARARGLDLIGIYHSHPDCDAYFSETDLKNSCPWYSFVVLSIKRASSTTPTASLPDPDQTTAEKEELTWPKS